MKRINNWENIQESTSFKRLTPNGYICKILKVEDHPEKEYLKIYFDIVKGDDKGYFKKQYDGDTRNERKHYFITQSDGSNPCKSPMGMFDSLEIDNDLKMVDDTIREYYGLKKASAPKAKSTTKEEK